MFPSPFCLRAVGASYLPMALNAIPSTASSVSTPAVRCVLDFESGSSSSCSALFTHATHPFLVAHSLAQLKQFAIKHTPVGEHLQHLAYKMDSSHVASLQQLRTDEDFDDMANWAALSDEPVHVRCVLRSGSGVTFDVSESSPLIKEKCGGMGNDRRVRQSLWTQCCTIL